MAQEDQVEHGHHADRAESVQHVLDTISAGQPVLQFEKSIIDAIFQDYEEVKASRGGDGKITDDEIRIIAAVKWMEHHGKYSIIDQVNLTVNLQASCLYWWQDTARLRAQFSKENGKTASGADCPCCDSKNKFWKKYLERAESLFDSLIKDQMELPGMTEEMIMKVYGAEKNDDGEYKIGDEALRCLAQHGGYVSPHSKFWMCIPGHVNEIGLKAHGGQEILRGPSIHAMDTDIIFAKTKEIKNLKHENRGLKTRVSDLEKTVHDLRAKLEASSKNEDSMEVDFSQSKAQASAAAGIAAQKREVAKTSTRRSRESAALDLGGGATKRQRVKGVFSGDEAVDSSSDSEDVSKRNAPERQVGLSEKAESLRKELESECTKRIKSRWRQRDGQRPSPPTCIVTKDARMSASGHPFKNKIRKGRSANNAQLVKASDPANKKYAHKSKTGDTVRDFLKQVVQDTGFLPQNAEAKFGKYFASL